MTGLFLTSTLCLSGIAQAAPYGWGYNGTGAVGAGNMTTPHNAAQPVLLTGVLVGKTIVKMAAGAEHTIALANDGKLYAWGKGTSGQLGNGADVNHDEPVAVQMNSGALLGKTITALAAGEEFSMAIADGKVFSWGANVYGQLGRPVGVATPGNVPVEVAGSLSGKTVVSIGAGFYHSLAVDSDGVVHAWGHNDYGQLGNASGTPSVPVALPMGWLPGGQTVTAVDGGEYHSLALTSGGQMFAWGYNGNGRLGRGADNTTDSSVPVAVDLSNVPGGQTVTAISTCWQHNLALTSGGRVLAWGSNGSKAVGIPSGHDGFIPTLMGGILAGGGVAEIGAGKVSSLVRMQSGQVCAWGTNNYGELCGAISVGANTYDPTFIALAPNLTGQLVTKLTVGGHHSIAATGTIGPEIEVTNGPTVVAHNSTLNFGAVTYPGGTTSITLSINNTGTTNLNLTGLIAAISGAQSGAFSVPPYTVTTVVPGGQVPLVVQFSPTILGLHSATLSIANNDADENPFVINLSGNGGSPAAEIEVFDGLTPLEDSLSTIGLPAVAVGGGSTRSIVVKNTGSAPLSGLVVTFDGPESGDFKADGVVMLTHAELASGATWTFTLSFNPAATGLRDAVMHIASNDADENPFDVNYLGFGNEPAGAATAYGWGYNAYGQTGDGTTGTNRNQAVPVLATGALTNKTISKMAAGGNHTLVIASDGKLYAWGSGTQGQLGNEADLSSEVPVPVKMLPGALEGKTIIAIAAGEHHSLALTSEGKVFAWGSNYYGQLGRGTNNTTSSNVPVQIGGSLDQKTVTVIGAGFSHSLAVTSDGIVHAWGRGDYGQLGNQSATPHVPVPLAMSWLPGGQTVIALDGGNLHSLALTSGGLMFAWGYNNDGELGVGGAVPAYSATPLAVDMSAVPVGQTVTAITSGAYHNLARTSGGKVLTWGYNGYKAAGISAGDIFVPTLIAGDLGGLSVAEIGAGWQSSLVRTDSGLVYAWGANTNGDLCGAIPVGDRTYDPTLIATAPNLTGQIITRLAVGGNHSIALAGVPAPEIEIAKVVGGTSTTLGLGHLLDFGATPVEGSLWGGPFIQITVTNSGITPLTNLAATVTSVHAADFIPSTLPSSLLPGEAATLYVTFDPSDVGSRVATLHISSNDADEGEFYVNLLGTSYYGSTGERVDAAFNPNVEGGAVLDTVVQPDGKIIVVGTFTTVGGAGHAHIARLNADGSVDTAFQAGADNSVIAVVLQADGKIIIGGYFNSLTSTNGVFPREHLARLNSDGSVDQTWYPSVDSNVHTLAVEPGNTLLAGGIFSYANVTALVPRLARFNLTDNGGVYLNFVPGSGGSVDEIVLHDGKILVGGDFASMGGVWQSNLARLNADGTADSSFIGTGCSGGGVRAIAVQPSDGKIVVGGAFDKANGYTNYRIARLNSNGSLDGSFYSAVPNTVYAIHVQADGRIVIGGDFEQVWSDGNWVQWPRLARLNANGKLDYTFPAAAYYDHVWTLEAESDGDLLVGGSFTYINALPRNNFARIAVAVPDIQLLSSGNLTYTNGGTHNFGTVKVPTITPAWIFTLQNVGAAPLTGFTGGGGITIDGPSASSFSLSAPGATSLASGESVTFSIFFNPQATGIYEAALHIHSNDPDEEPFTITLIGTGGQPITDWRQQNFSPAQVTAGQDADDADPDQDGISNLMEFATAGAPNTSNSVAQSLEPPTAGFVEFHYSRNKLAMAELVYQVEWNDVLSATGWSGAGVTETILSDNGLVQQVNALVPTGGNDQRFVHLKVTRVP